MRKYHNLPDTQIQCIIVCERFTFPITRRKMGNSMCIGTTGYPFGKKKVGFLPQNLHPSQFLTDQRFEDKNLRPKRKHEGISTALRVKTTFLSMI